MLRATPRTEKLLIAEGDVIFDPLLNHLLTNIFVFLFFL